MTSGIFYLSSLITFISIWLVCIATVFFCSHVFNANSVDPDQTPRSAASDLDLHCLPMPLFYGTLGINGLISQYKISLTSMYISLRTEELPIFTIRYSPPI